MIDSELTEDPIRRGDTQLKQHIDSLKTVPNGGLSPEPHASQTETESVVAVDMNLEARNERGLTPLHDAAMSETGEAVTALLEAGADQHRHTAF